MTTKTLHFLNDFLPSAFAGTVTVAWTPIKPVTESEQQTFLSDQEVRVWKGFDHEVRRLEFAATRRLLHQMVRQLPVDDDYFELKKDQWGKPYGFCRGTTYPVSIAHTKQHVLCGLSLAEPIGVDLEPVNRKVPKRLRSRILNSEEESLLADEPMLRIWTIKEALVKLRGRGMRMNLNECIVTSKSGNQFTAKFNDDKTAKICSLRQHKHWMAFAWNS